MSGDLDALGGAGLGEMGRSQDAQKCCRLSEKRRDTGEGVGVGVARPASLPLPAGACRAIATPLPCPPPPQSGRRVMADGISPKGTMGGRPLSKGGTAGLPARGRGS